METQDTSTTDNNPKDMVSLLQAIQGELNLLRTELKRKDDKIESLEKRIEDMDITHKEEMRYVKNEICDLKERALNTEMYLSKDTIIINNPPACNNTNIMDTVVGFLMIFSVPEYNPRISRLCIFWANLGNPLLL